MTDAIRNALDLLDRLAGDYGDDGRFDAEIKALETEGQKISAVAEQMGQWARELEGNIGAPPTPLATHKARIAAGLREAAADITGLHRWANGDHHPSQLDIDWEGQGQ